MSQEKQILKHLQSRKRLTQFQALTKFGCFRLAARIGNLKEKGHNIQTTPIYKNGKRFAQYHLVK
ncbi:helix-turn-helix domain-containing protein [Candidatus Pacearchaeota archaeon]|nr:helix-turn-helix domain-containing protein [Candidatus Pacearchaeota archaeon]